MALAGCRDGSRTDEILTKISIHEESRGVSNRFWIRITYFIFGFELSKNRNSVYTPSDLDGLSLNPQTI